MAPRRLSEIHPSRSRDSKARTQSGSDGAGIGGAFFVDNVGRARARWSSTTDTVPPEAVQATVVDAGAEGRTFKRAQNTIVAWRSQNVTDIPSFFQTRGEKLFLYTTMKSKVDSLTILNESEKVSLIKAMEKITYTEAGATVDPAIAAHDMIIVQLGALDCLFGGDASAHATTVLGAGDVHGLSTLLTGQQAPGDTLTVREAGTTIWRLSPWIFEEVVKRSVTRGRALALGALRRSELFSMLSESVLNRIVDGMVQLSYESGKHIYKPGETLDALFVLCQGSVQCVHEDTGITEDMGPGTMFGAESLFHDDFSMTVDLHIKSKALCYVMERSFFEKTIGVYKDVVARANVKENLGDLTFFRELSSKCGDGPAPDFSTIADVMDVEVFAEHSDVVVEGDDGDRMYVIMEGMCHVIFQGVKVSVLQAGDHFGEMVRVRPRLGRNAAQARSSPRMCPSASTHPRPPVRPPARLPP